MQQDFVNSLSQRDRLYAAIANLST